MKKNIYQKCSRMTAVLLAAAMLLTGCGGSGDTPSASEKAESTTRESTDTTKETDSADAKKDTEKQLKALEEAVRQEQETGGKTAKKHRESSSAAAKESHPLASFLIGLVLLGAGIFWVLNSFVVSFSWGSLWGGFGMNTSLATGLMLVPLLIGIGLLFFLDRKWIGWVVTAIGLLAILVTLLTSVRFRPVSASLWQYVVMFGMIAAGCGLVARGLLKSRD